MHFCIFFTSFYRFILKLTQLRERVFFSRMKLTAIILLLLNFHVLAIAANYEGDVKKSADSVYLVDQKSGEKFLLTGSIALQANFKMLTSGDFISIDGTRSLTKGTITAKSINYVGLKKLLGVWSTEDAFCYNFISYNNLIVTRKINGQCTSNYPSEYTYIINPESRVWTLLVSGENNSYVGDLYLPSSDTLEIDLYDSETGAILRQLSLRKHKSENTTNPN